ncbi:MAG: pyruvate kinase [Bacteroidetes bacterium]|nr:pyruvate kinase [Bacteroidota bacterium]
MSQQVLYNKTKIIATIGPATESLTMLRKIIKAGVDVCRINFSHGTHDQHRRVIQNIRLINDELGLSVAILGDLQGPKLRVGEMKPGTILKDGQSLLVTTHEEIGNHEKVYVNYHDLPKEIQKGEHILIDDGNIELKVTDIVDDHTIKTKVIDGGVLKSNKGFNLPHTQVALPCLTPKDLEDLRFALEMDIDWIGLSFVRQPSDIRELRQHIQEAGSDAHIVAKIEKPQAVKHIDAIIKETDAVMVARGDLGVEIPLERVPIIQKSIVDKCIDAKKPVIIATQMMESMISHPRPTRAETNDVANAVMDGADAVMLSAETSVGEYPLEVVQTMEKIVSNTELNWNIYYKGKKPAKTSPTFLSDEICFTAVRMSDHIKAKAIISLTYSGYTAFQIAGYRPNCDIFIFTSNKTIFRMLSLVWNVRVFYYDKEVSTDDTITDVVEILKDKKLLKTGDVVVHTASMPINAKSRTNALKIGIVD